MKYVGAHVSAEGGVSYTPLRAIDIGARAFSFFTKNQKRWFSKPYSQEEISLFKKNLKISKILATNVLPHSSYLINLGHPDITMRKQSIAALIDESNRCEQLGLTKINVHPGSHLRIIDENTCLTYIVQSINQVHAATNKVIVVVENTAGQGSNLGYKFEHLATIIDRVKNKKRIGVCIDTCHLFASGIDFRTKKQYQDTWAKFDQIIGFNYLQGMHFNDSKGDLGSLIDRHDSLGKGKIGLAPFKYFMQDRRFDGLPLILETIDHQIWEQEIKILYSFIEH